jgi:hypothetical protein
VSAQRCNDLRLTGSGGANRVMEAEMKRLVMRSPFDVRADKAKREGEATLLYPFDARVAWVAGCHHRTSSRISWDLCSSPAVRLSRLRRSRATLVGRAPSRSSAPAYFAEVGPCSDFEASPLQLRGVVKNAVVALASGGARPTSIPIRRRSCSSSGAPELRRGVRGGHRRRRRARHRRGARVTAGPACCAKPWRHS